MYYCIANFEEIKEHKKMLTVISDITEEYYNLLAEKEQTLAHFLFLNNYYKMLFMNIDELLNYITQIENKESKTAFEIEEYFLNVNRLTINFLGLFFLI